MHQNSLTAYRTSRYSARENAIINAIKSEGAGTDRGIMRRLGKSDPNSVRPRITSLVQIGALEEVGQAIDSETGKTVRVVDLPRSELFKACIGMANAQALAANKKQLTLGF